MMGAVLGYQGASFGKAQVEALANFYSLGMDEKVGIALTDTKVWFLRQFNPAHSI